MTRDKNGARQHPILVCGVVGLLCGLAVWSLISPSGQAPGANVLLLSIDSLRPDHLGSYGYSRQTSPNLDRLAREGVRFFQAFNQTSWTSPALVSVLTSLYPETHGADRRDHSTPPSLQTPMKALDQRWGYAVPALCYLIAIPEFSNLGFVPLEEKIEGQNLFRWLEHNRYKRFFVWHHLRGPHLPYNPPPRFAQMFLPEETNLGEEESADVAVIQKATVIPRHKQTFRQTSHATIAALYDGKVRQTDEEVGAILAKLEELELLDKTLIVVTADHGEELFDHGFVGHASTSLAGTLYDEVIRVPLIMRLPGVLPAGKVVEQQVEGIDVMPTIFDLLGLPPPPAVQGTSLLSLIQDWSRGRREYAFSETLPCGRQCTGEEPKEKLQAVRTPQWKLIVSPDPRGQRYELYNLQDDPHETTNVFSHEPQLAHRLRRKLEQWQVLSRLKRQELVGQPILAGLQDAAGEADSATPPVVVQPQADEALTYDQEEGKVRLAWAGKPAVRYEVQYDVGVDEYHLEGALTVIGPRKEFGPLERSVWDLLPLYNPFRFRVRDTRCQQDSCWSAWMRFQIQG